MTRYAAFLRGVNLGKRTVKSAELKAAFEAMGFTDVKTLLASGNVLFDSKGARGLKAKIESGLEAAFGFSVGTVVRPLDALKAMVASDPFAGMIESEAAKLHVMLFDEVVPAKLKPKGIEGDFDVATVGSHDIYFIFHRKPDGTYLGGSDFALEKELPKGTLVTMRNWNTILTAIA
ncbi:MAG: DUF1697 domain-containing protein [Devosia sp.]